jgi:hypothetical protein
VCMHTHTHMHAPHPYLRTDGVSVGARARRGSVSWGSARVTTSRATMWVMLGLGMGVEDDEAGMREGIVGT